MGERIYRTADGRHVPEGDPEAAYLAYTQFDDVPDAVVTELTDPGNLSEDGSSEGKQADPAAADKQAVAPADKRRSRAADKSA